MNFFDYFFFRMTRAYMKRDGREAKTAKIGLSTLQFLIFTGVILLCYKPFFSRAVTAPYSKLFGCLGALILIAFIVFNYRRYDRKKYNELLLKWEKEPHVHKLVHGIIVYMSIPVFMSVDIFLIVVM